MKATFPRLATGLLRYSALGAAPWTALYLGLGLVFREQVGQALIVVERSGEIAIVVIAAAFAMYFAGKWWRRRKSFKTSS